MRRFSTIFLSFLIFSFHLSAQEKRRYDSTDIKEIKASSLQLIKEYEQLLNLIADEGVGHVQRNEIIVNSYSEISGQQIFKNASVIVEDDLQNQERDDLKVDVYLKKFDLLYAKQPTNSISFKNIQISEVLANEYIYVEIYFESQFSGSNLLEKEPFLLTKRVATIEAKRQKGTLWDSKIVGITFYNPVIHNFSQKKNIPIQEITIRWEGDNKSSLYTIYNGEKLLGTTSDTSFNIINHHDLQNIQVFNLGSQQNKSTTIDIDTIQNTISQDKKTSTIPPIRNRRKKKKTNIVGIILVAVTIPLILISLFTKN